MGHFAPSNSPSNLDNALENASVEFMKLWWPSPLLFLISDASRFPLLPSSTKTSKWPEGHCHEEKLQCITDNGLALFSQGWWLVHWNLAISKNMLIQRQLRGMNLNLQRSRIRKGLESLQHFFHTYVSSHFWLVALKISEQSGGTDYKLHPHHNDVLMGRVVVKTMHIITTVTSNFANSLSS